MRALSKSRVQAAGKKRTRRSRYGAEAGRDYVSPPPSGGGALQSREPRALGRLLEKPSTDRRPRRPQEFHSPAAPAICGIPDTREPLRNRPDEFSPEPRRPRHAAENSRQRAPRGVRGIRPRWSRGWGGKHRRIAPAHGSCARPASRSEEHTSEL